MVAIDAGHGGSADNASPNQPFDPGVIGPAGTMEKDLTLDIAKRVQRLLITDRVRVVMTRVDDRFVDIGPRMDAANAARASLFVSIHLNSYPDPSMAGALVLYPDAASLAFAQLMSDTIGRYLPAAGIADDGVQAKSDLWVHATMPAVTVEAAYLSNPREEQLLGSQSTRDTLASAIVSGIERQAPAIALRRAAILSWEQAHGIRQTPLPSLGSASGAASASGHPGPGNHQNGAVPADDRGSGVRNGLLVLIGMGAFWQRRPLWRGLLAGAAHIWWQVSGHVEQSAVGGHRRRLKVNRRQAVLQRSRRASMSRRSIYDEFSI
ncbi:MAG: hypothetical protein NVSMB29_03460 [Candidatus Dormibacteria bacterium]